MLYTGINCLTLGKWHLFLAYLSIKKRSHLHLYPLILQNVLSKFNNPKNWLIRITSVVMLFTKWISIFGWARHICITVLKCGVVLSSTVWKFRWMTFSNSRNTFFHWIDWLIGKCWMSYLNQNINSKISVITEADL